MKLIIIAMAFFASSAFGDLNCAQMLAEGKEKMAKSPISSQFEIDGATECIKVAKERFSVTNKTYLGCNLKNSAMDCFKIYLKANPPQTIAGLTVLNVLAVGVSTQDKTQKICSPESCVAKMLDIVLATFEAIVPTNFSVIKVKPKDADDKKAYQILVNVSTDVYKRFKGEILTLVNKRLAELYTSLPKCGTKCSSDERATIATYSQLLSRYKAVEKSTMEFK